MLEFKKGDLVRMKHGIQRDNHRDWYWMAGCIGRLIRKSGSYADDPWYISFDNCGNPEGTFAPKPDGWHGYDATLENKFTMHARHGSVENPKPEPVEATIESQRYSRYTYQPYPPTNTF